LVEENKYLNFFTLLLAATKKAEARRRVEEKMKRTKFKPYAEGSVMTKTKRKRKRNGRKKRAGGEKDEEEEEERERRKGKGERRKRGVAREGKGREGRRKKKKKKKTFLKKTLMVNVQGRVPFYSMKETVHAFSQSSP